MFQKEIKERKNITIGLRESLLSKEKPPLYIYPHIPRFHLFSRRNIVCGKTVCAKDNLSQINFNFPLRSQFAIKSRER